MNHPKRHHFVPEMLQDRFTDHENSLWVYDSRNPSKGVWPVGPSNILLEGHLYSYTAPDGTKDVTLEHEFSVLESKAAPIIEKMVTSIRLGRLPGLTEIERETWSTFFYQQWRRVPDFYKAIYSFEQHKVEYETLLGELDALGRKVSEAERQYLLSDATLQRSYRNIRVATLRNPNDGVLETIERRGIAFANASPKKSFILGSHPVAKLTPKGDHHLIQLTVEAWLPIASDVLVGLGNSQNPELLCAISSNNVRHINEAIAKQSTQIVGCSKQLLLSLARFVGTHPRVLQVTQQ